MFMRVIADLVENGIHFQADADTLVVRLTGSF
jgi:hypothetical protein